MRGEFADELAQVRANRQVGTRVWFENDRVRVWDLKLDPGERAPFHTHATAYFWTCTSAGDAIQRFADGREEHLHYDVGQTKFTDCSEDSPAGPRPRKRRPVCPAFCDRRDGGLRSVRVPNVTRAGARGEPGRGQRALVMGGSIGGLTAAILLRRLGYAIAVYERSHHALEGRGAGIVVHPITIRYLTEEVGMKVQALATRTDWLRFLDARGGLQYRERRPYWVAAWNSLYRPLLEALGSEFYELNAPVVAVEPGDARARLHIVDGRSDEGQLVVCADGIASTARSLLLPQVGPHYSGYVGWRGTIAEEALTDATRTVLQDAITYQLLHPQSSAHLPDPDR